MRYLATGDDIEVVIARDVQAVEVFLRLGRNARRIAKEQHRFIELVQQCQRLGDIGVELVTIVDHTPQIDNEGIVITDYFFEFHDSHSPIVMPHLLRHLSFLVKADAAINAG